MCTKQGENFAQRASTCCCTAKRSSYQTVAAALHKSTCNVDCAVLNQYFNMRAEVVSTVPTCSECAKLPLIMGILMTLSVFQCSLIGSPHFVTCGQAYVMCQSGCAGQVRCLSDWVLCA